MESGMRGQFYVVGALMFMMYLVFLSKVFVTIETQAELPKVSAPSNIFYVFQEIADSGGDTKTGATNLLNALKLSDEYFAVYCESYATGESSCILPEADWECGVNVTASTGTRAHSTVTDFIQRKNNFATNETRIPVFIESNTTRNLAELSISFSGLTSSPMIVDGSRVIKGTCSGGTCTFRSNIKGNEPKTVYLYNVSHESYTLFKDVGILNDTGYDGTELINVIGRYYSYEKLDLEDLRDLWGNAGPVLLFIPGTYPEAYENDLLDYVKEGGIIVSVYGLCKESGSCLTGNLERITDQHTLANASGFSVNLSTTNSNYFTKADVPWAIYNSSTTNSSRAALGASRYGEGWVVFVGNESMLKTWDRLEDFTNFTISWAIPPANIQTKTCPLQKA